MFIVSSYLQHENEIVILNYFELFYCTYIYTNEFKCLTITINLAKRHKILMFYTIYIKNIPIISLMINC